MAYVNDENDKNAAPETPDATAALTTSSAPGAGPGAQTKGGAPQSTPAQPFQNLQAYLGANQPQVNQQASQIAGNLTNQYGETKQAIDEGLQGFNQQIQGGYAAPNQDVVNQAVNNTTQFAQDPNNVKAFQALYNDQYTGPGDFESTTGYGDLNAKVNKAVGNADLLKTNQGLQTYFQGKNPNSTKGGSILDSVLLQGTPEASQKIREAAKPLSTLSDYLNTGTSTANQNITNAQKTAQDTSAAVRNQFTGEGGIIPNWEKSLTSNATQAEKQRQDYNNALNGYLSKSAGITQSFNPLFDALERNGVSPVNLNLPKAEFSNIPATVGNVASQQDVELQNALGKLTGNNINLVDPNQAGTFKNPGTFDFNESQALADPLRQSYEQLANIWNTKYGGPPQPGKGYDISQLTKPWSQLLQSLQGQIPGLVNTFTGEKTGKTGYELNPTAFANLPQLSSPSMGAGGKPIFSPDAIREILGTV